MSHQQKTIVITNVDSFVGYALAHRFLRGQQQENDQQRGGQKCKFRLLCREKRHVEQLEQMGGEIWQLDYSEERKVKEALQNACLVMLVPEHTSNARKEAENVLRAARENQVEYVAMFSILNADRAQGRMLREYHQIEEHVQREFQNKSCIVRYPIFDQFYYYLTPMVEDRNKMMLPVERNRKWSSVNIRDVVDAVYRLSREHGKRNNQEFGRLGEKHRWEFTPSQARSGEEIARGMSRALDKEQVQYEKISEQELRQYLEGIRQDKRFKHRPQQEHRPNDSNEQSRKDQPEDFPLGDYLHKEVIQLIMEFWEMANRGDADKTTRDLEEALGRKPQDLHEYFQNNRDQFQRLR